MNQPAGVQVVRPIPQKYLPWCHSFEQLQFLRGVLARPDVLETSSLWAYSSLTAYGLWREAEDVHEKYCRLWQNVSLDLDPARSAKLNQFWKGWAPLPRFRDDEAKSKLLLARQNAYLPCSKGSDRTMVVFGTGFNTMGVAVPVLHSILDDIGFNVLYLKPQTVDFTCASMGLGDTPSAIAQSVKNFCQKQQLKVTGVFGHSSSFYVAMRVAGLIGADSFIGFGPKSNFETVGRKSLERRPLLLGFYEDALQAGLGNITQYDEIHRIRDVNILTGTGREEDVIEGREIAEALARVKYVEFPGAPHNVVWEAIYGGWLLDKLRRLRGTTRS